MESAHFAHLFLVMLRPPPLPSIRARGQSTRPADSCLNCTDRTSHPNQMHLSPAPAKCGVLIYFKSNLLEATYRSFKRFWPTAASCNVWLMAASPCCGFVDHYGEG
eukprot:6204914-Pleurochrysis_carterae.AAC.2